MRRFFTALGFLTLIPCPKQTEVEEKDLGQSMSVFPLVGLLLGLILILLDTLLSPLLTERLTNIIIIAFLIIITGGIHMDGFMDTIDGIVGGRSREEILKIMRDSRAGALGVIFTLLLILLKWEALNSLIGREKTTALLLMPAIGRWGMVLLTHISPYVRKEGIGRPFVEELRRREVLFALITIFILSVVLKGFAGIAILLAASLIGLIWSKWFFKKIGGVTGDVIGAFNEFLEVFVLLLFSIIN